jgi:hypothetical protein
MRFWFWLQHVVFQRLGGQLPEEQPVSRCELPGMPESPAPGDLIHGRCVRGDLQLLTDAIKPNRPEIGHWTHTPDLLEGMVQRPLAYSQFLTKVEHRNGLSQFVMHVIFGAANQAGSVGRLASGTVVVRSSEQRQKSPEALLLE